MDITIIITMNKIKDNINIDVIFYFKNQIIHNNNICKQIYLG